MSMSPEVESLYHTLKKSFPNCLLTLKEMIIKKARFENLQLSQFSEWAEESLRLIAGAKAKERAMLLEVDEMGWS